MAAMWVNDDPVDASTNDLPQVIQDLLEFSTIVFPSFETRERSVKAFYELIASTTLVLLCHDMLHKFHLPQGKWRESNGKYEY